jgi:hypothetical protein
MEEMMARFNETNNRYGRSSSHRSSSSQPDQDTTVELAPKEKRNKKATQRLQQYLESSSLPGEVKQEYSSLNQSSGSYSHSTQTPPLERSLPVRHSSVESALDKFRTATIDAGTLYFF